jgi:cysteine desulfurase
MKKIYLDNAATTQVDERVLKSMLPYFNEEFANPHAVHSAGQSALDAIEKSRETVAKFFNCDDQEIIFTAGATEGNNIAIQGILKNLKDKKIHIICSAIEHPAVLETCKEMKKRGVELDLAPVDENGVVKLDKLKGLIKDNTVLVSVMYANNEVGSVQSIEEIGGIVQLEKEKRGNKLPIYFHTDAVQAVNYLDCDVKKLNCDILTMSGHKINGPKGTGAMYLRKGVKLSPILFGGHQEFGIRPGTANVPGIVGLAKAIELISTEGISNCTKVKKIRDKLVKEISKIENIKINCDLDNSLPNILNVSFLKAEGESILMMLDMEGIAISTGSACSSGSLDPSHVLMAMGRKPEWSHGSIRISLSKFNSEIEVTVFMKALNIIIEKLRKMAP